MKKSFFALAVVTLLLGGSLSSSAAVVSFQFSGYLSSINNPANALPAGTVYGAPFTGSFSYDTAAILDGIDFENSTTYGDFYFHGPGFNLAMTFAGHTFSNLTVYPPGSGNSAIIIKNDAPADSDSIAASTGNSILVMDGGALPGVYDQAALVLELDDKSYTALNSDALPTTPPRLADFPTMHRIELIASAQNVGITYIVSGTITNISAASNPKLIIRANTVGTVELAWPLTAQGFSLQQNTNLTAGVGWQTNATPILDTATEHTVTLSASGSMSFFRLISP